MMENDSIKNPKHYTQGIECWDYIVSHDMNYLEGNIIKYITRWREKNGVEDLKKAQAYLEKLIEIAPETETKLIIPTSNNLCEYWHKGECMRNPYLEDYCSYCIDGMCDDRD